jgi:integrase
LIRHSKTPAGWREPTLNPICREALSALRENAVLINAADSDHYLFPSQVGGKLDPTRPAKGWRSAWRSILKAADIQCRFHDLRHSAVTTMAEKGLPEAVIMAQVGHISPAMLKRYTHIRRQGMNAAADALQPATRQTEAEMVN